MLPIPILNITPVKYYSSNLLFSSSLILGIRITLDGFLKYNFLKTPYAWSYLAISV